MEDEKQIAINAYIRKQFRVITQTELKTSQVFSEIICETCFDSTHNLAIFRIKLLENQQKLEEAHNEGDEIFKDDVQEVFSPLMKLESDTEFKVEYMSEEDEVTNEEHLDLDFIETFANANNKKCFVQQQTENFEVVSIEEKFKTPSEKTKLCSG